MRRAFWLVVMVAVALNCAVAVTGDDCTCTSSCPIDITEKQLGVTISGRAGLPIPLGKTGESISVSGSVNLSYTLATTVAVQHKCSCRPAPGLSLRPDDCCPTTVSTVAYVYAKEHVTGIWDPTIPGSELAPRDAVVKTALALPPAKGIQRSGPTVGESACRVEETYNAQGLAGHLSLSFAASLGYRQISASARIGLSTRTMTVECSATCTSCAGRQCAAAPKLVVCPGTEPGSPIILLEGGEVAFGVEMLDPDGPSDVTRLWVEETTGGAAIEARLNGLTAGEEPAGGLETRKGSVTLTWRPGIVDGSVVLFVEDQCGHTDFRKIYYQVVVPPQIALVSGPTLAASPCCPGEGITWTVEITDPTYSAREQERPGYCISVTCRGGGAAGLVSRGGSCLARILRSRAIPTWRETVTYCPDGSVDPCWLCVTVVDLDRGTSASWETSVESPELNHPPEADPISLEPPVWTPVSYRTQVLVMDPAWFDVGCLRVTDRDGDDVTIGIENPPLHGVASVTRSGVPGQYTVTVMYQASPMTLLAWHRSRRLQTDRFTVVADDHRGGRTEIPVTIASNVLDAAPTCGADVASTESGVPVDICVLANDADLDLDTLAIASVGTPNHGAVTFALGAVTYTPARDISGEDSFTYTVTDGYGGTASGLVTVTVTDAEPPAFAWEPPAPARSNDPGVCGAVVTWDEPVIGLDVTDNIGVTSLTSTHAPGSSFPVGTTTVTYTAEDSAGNQAACAFTVAVEDHEPPVLHDVPADIVTALLPGEVSKVVSWVPATASDNCGIRSLSSTHAPGTAFPIGMAVVTTVACDVHGNEEQQAFLVTVYEGLGVITRDIEVRTESDHGERVTFSVETTGGCPPVAVECMPESGSFFHLGTTRVSVTATDACGTVVRGSFTITVTREETPNRSPIARDDNPPDMTTWWIVVPVLANDDDPDGDDLTLVSMGVPPCGDAVPWNGDPNAIYFFAAACDAYKGKRISFGYEIEDEHGARAQATVTVRIPDDINLPQVQPGR